MSIKTYTIDTGHWQVVPREMTHKMRDVIRMGNGGWRELLAAAPEPPAQPEVPMRDLLAEAREQVEALDRENHKMRRCVARLMARLTVWLDDDQFNEADGIMYPEFEPPAQQPMTEEQIMREIPGIGWDDRVEDVLPIVRAVERFHGISGGESNAD